MNSNNSFISSHLNCYSTVWHFRLRDSDKIEKLNKKALRTIFQDYMRLYQTTRDAGTWGDGRSRDVLYILNSPPDVPSPATIDIQALKAYIALENNNVNRKKSSPIVGISKC